MKKLLILLPLPLVLFGFEPTTTFAILMAGAKLVQAALRELQRDKK